MVQAKAQEFYCSEQEPTLAEMSRMLKEEYGEFNAPAEATLRDWRDKRIIWRNDLDGPWSFADGDPDAALVMPFLRLHLEAQAARRERAGEWSPKVHATVPTRRMVRWVVRLLKADPDMPRGTAWILAAHARNADYSAAAGQPNDGIARVQAMLAIAPWRHPGDDLLDRAVDARVVPEDITDVLEPPENIGEALSKEVYRP